MRAHERFLRYIQFDTASRDASQQCPSTEGQRVFGCALVDEMKALGICDARIDEYGYVYGSIAANTCGAPVIGLIAHMDTVDGVPCMPMNARIISSYDGGDITLDADGKYVLRLSDYPHLAQHIGHDLIVTDGHTILGADNKAGVAEIMTLCERLMADCTIPHGKIAIGFTPDEEIGRGADKFDVAAFGADFAYTVDGGPMAEIEYENFNAASARITINGISTHPGGAKNRMRNALLVGMEFNAMLPPAETPAHTEGYEGFYHITSMTGNEENACLKYIVRDHDKSLFESRKDYIRGVASYLNSKYGADTVNLDIADSYYNMREMVEPHMYIVDRAMNVMRQMGYDPKTVPIRGGTDGSRLSYMGLPCPNLSTGGMNGHGRYECADVQEMDDIVTMLELIVRTDTQTA